jgi:phenylalanyl-tRNA synthetase beta subunit (EC 6.1.1.20)
LAAGQADADYQDIKGLIEHFSLFFKLPQVSFENCQTAHPYLLPCVTVSIEGQDAGVIGRFKPEIADIYHARKDVWYADLNADALFGMVSGRNVLFNPLPQFPPVRRDITIISPLGLTIKEILDKSGEIKMPLLEEVELIDLYSPKGEEVRNLTFRFTFRHKERTLKDGEVDHERERMAEFLLKSLPVRI